jgi:hypothetical protein
MCKAEACTSCNGCFCTRCTSATQPLKCHCAPLCAAGAARQQAPQRLFGREAENQHIEVLGVAALAAKTLRQLLPSPTPLLPAPDAAGDDAAAGTAAAAQTLQQTVRKWATSALQVRCSTALTRSCIRVRSLCTVSRARQFWSLFLTPVSPENKQV